MVSRALSRRVAGFGCFFCGAKERRIALGILSPISGEPSLLIFWQDERRSYSYAQIQTWAQTLRVVFENLPKGAVCALIGFAPLETWILTLAAWSQGVSVLPFAQRASDAAIDLALAQIPWSLRISRNGEGEQGAFLGPQNLLVDRNEVATSTEADIFLMSSGSTGTPKAIGHSIESLSASARATLEFYQFAPGESWLLSLDPSHIGGLQILIRVWLGQGLCYYGGEPKDIGHALTLRSFDFLSLVPTQLLRLFEIPEAAIHLRKAKAILLGGAATQESLLTLLKSLSLPISITFGSSETASQISAFKPGVLPTKPGEVGEILPIWSVQERENSDLLIEGPALLKGYWHEMKWFGRMDRLYPLSDQGHIENGHLILEGRKDQIFQVGGENVSPKEILQLIEAVHPLSDMLLIAQPDA
ncbi:MAG: hypothetical protein EOP10_29605, partial [Proteobacteria bacterium]